ncbi:TPA: hypothetical protein ACH3X1_009799 [Trebouxia sp. C0004]
MIVSKVKDSMCCDFGASFTQVPALANHPIKTAAETEDLTSLILIILLIIMACAYGVTLVILLQGMHCYSSSPQGSDF